MNPGRFIGRAGVLIIRCLVVLVGFAVICFGAEGTTSVVTVAYVEGEVTLKPQGKANGIPLSEDRVVAAGDEIDTGKDGSVELVLPDESVIRVGPQSVVRIKKAGYVEVTKQANNVLELIYGKVRAVVAPLVNAESVFMIETENTTVGVRGTDFVVSHDRTAKETDVICSDGSVELKPRDIVRKGLTPILVRGDEGIKLVAGRLPEKPARWLDDRKKLLFLGLEFKGKRSRKILEQRLKYLQNRGETVIDGMKDSGNVIKNRTNRVFNKIIRH